MPGKRGRPITLQSNDPAIIRRREKNAERVRRYLERKRADRDNAVRAVALQTSSFDHNAISTPEEEGWPTLAAHSQSTALPDSRLNETPQNQEAVHWQLEQAYHIEPSLQCNGVSVNTRGGHASEHDKAITSDLEDTTVHTVQTEQSQEPTRRYDEPERQDCAVDVVMSIRSRQEEQMNAVKQQSLLRRRQLAAVRQRRYRNRQRILQGFPLRIREENLQHGETLIDFATNIDDQAENMILTQPHKRISQFGSIVSSNVTLLFHLRERNRFDGDQVADMWQQTRYWDWEALLSLLVTSNLARARQA